MKIYAVLGILMILCGAVLWIDRNAVLREEGKRERHARKALQASTQQVLANSAAESKKHRQLRQDLESQVAQLRAEAGELRAHVSASSEDDGQPVMCRPGCLVQ